MSIVTHFASIARGHGLIGHFGAAASSLPSYGELQQLSQVRRARTDALLRGQAVGGRKLDGAPAERRDSIAKDTAAALEWAERYEMTFGPGAGKAFLNLASGQRQDGAKLDTMVPMASQALTHFMPTVYEIQHPDLVCWEKKILGVDTSISPAANEVVWYDLDNMGSARVSNTYDLTTIPMVPGPQVSDNVIKIVPGMVGFSTNFMDPRREALASSNGKPDFDIEGNKRRACERSLAEFVDALWWAGDGTLGIDGLMKNPFVETSALAGGPWAGKTALQILDDLIAMVWSIPNRSIGTLQDLGKLTMWLPPSQYQLLMQPITAAGDTSILAYFVEFFQQSGRGVPKVMFDWRFSATSSQVFNGGPQVLDEDTALIVYQEGNKDRDPMFILPQDIEVPTAVRMTGVGDVTLYHVRAGGLRLPDARKLLYIVGL